MGTRGPCHNRSAAYDPDIQGEVDRFKVDDTRGELAKDTEEYAAVYDTLPLCKFIRRCFTGKADRAGAWPTIAQLINATTGWDFKYEDIDLIGERAHTIKKAFNIREGWKREDDTIPYRWMHDPMTKGPSAGYVTTREELEYMKDLYYKAKGWTKEGMIPKTKTDRSWACQMLPSRSAFNRTERKNAIILLQPNTNILTATLNCASAARSVSMSVHIPRPANTTPTAAASAPCERTKYSSPRLPAAPVRTPHV